MTETGYNQAKANALARWMTKLTGHQWRAITDAEYFNDYSRKHDGDWNLVSPDFGLAIGLDWNGYGNPGKYRVGCSRYKVPMATNFGTSKMPDSINVSGNRTPESIAKDIMRRFYPDFEQYEQYLNEQVEIRCAQIDRTDEIKALFKSAGLSSYGQANDTGGMLSHRFCEGRSVDIRFNVYEKHDSYDIKISTDDLEVVAQVLQAMQYEVQP